MIERQAVINVSQSIAEGVRQLKQEMRVLLKAGAVRDASEGREAARGAKKWRIATFWLGGGGGKGRFKRAEYGQKDDSTY